MIPDFVVGITCDRWWQTLWWVFFFSFIFSIFTFVPVYGGITFLMGWKAQLRGNGMFSALGHSFSRGLEGSARGWWYALYFRASALDLILLQKWVSACCCVTAGRTGPLSKGNVGSAGSSCPSGRFLLAWLAPATSREIKWAYVGPLYDARSTEHGVLAGLQKLGAAAGIGLGQ